MGNIFDMFPSNYLDASDFTPEGETLAISHVQLEKMTDTNTNKEVEKPVVYLTGKEKGLVLNVTNAKTIAAVTGTTDPEQWPGKEIVAYQTTTMFGRKEVDCVRMRDPNATPF
jgi:hypothetical protein